MILEVILGVSAVVIALSLLIQLYTTKIIFVFLPEIIFALVGAGFLGYIFITTDYKDEYYFLAFYSLLIFFTVVPILSSIVILAIHYFLDVKIRKNVDEL